MFDHVTIRVSDRAASERFYETVLRSIGIETSYTTNAFCEWDDFSISTVGDGQPLTTGLHVGFVAPSRAQVDEFWQAGTEAGYRDDGAPGPREYTGDYYGAFLLDPDGNSIEAVHHEGMRQGGIIDHLWIRVADLAASAAFYRVVAEAAGFDARPMTDERAGFGDDSGGSLSLVPGTPSQNVHIAFPGDEDAVRRFYEDAVAAGYTGNGEPAERPRYHPGYYAAYALDPDGNNIEVVDHHRS